MLTKTAVAIGKFVSVPGKYWTKCPAADKAKRFKCVVVSFTALHDFGDGVKGAGFFLKEMGEDGRGSLEPGVASGAEFVMAYAQPFLEYYYDENRTELPERVRNTLFPGDDVLTTAGDAASPGAEGGPAAQVEDDDAARAQGAPAKVKEEARRLRSLST